MLAGRPAGSRTGPGAYAAGSPCAAGEHEVVVVLEERKEDGARRSILEGFPTYDLGPWPEGLTLRREEIYGDDGR